MGIAVAAKVQNGLAARVASAFAFEPNLADATADLVGVVARVPAQRLERAAELDDVAIAILPVVEERKIGADGFDRGQRRPLQPVERPAYIPFRRPRASLSEAALKARRARRGRATGRGGRSQ
jgi:hypothetical protein